MRRIQMLCVTLAAAVSLAEVTYAVDQPAQVKQLGEVPALELQKASDSHPEIHRIKTAAAFKRLGGQDGFAFDFKASDLVIVRGKLGCAHGKVECKADGNTTAFSVQVTDRCNHRTLILHWFPYAAAFAVSKDARIGGSVFIVGPETLPQGELNRQLADKLKDTNATHLNLSGMGVNDADLAKLKRFQNLTHLYLSDNQITDKGLANLSHLTTLYELYLDNNPGVTAAGLKHLKDIMTARIQILGIGNTQVTAAGLKQLQDWSAQQKRDFGHTQINHSIVTPRVYE